MKSMSFMKKFLYVTVFLLLSSWVSNAVATSELQSMRVGQTAEKTRVVFDVKRMGQYKVSRLSNPSRLVVDFNKAANKLSFEKKHLSDKRLFKIRVSDTAKRTRVVLDLHKHFDYKAFSLAKNKSGVERLVIDLTDINSTKRPPQKQKITSVAKNTAPITSQKNPSSKPKAVQISNPLENKQATPLIKMASRTSSGKEKLNPATQSLLNKESSVFSQPKELVIAIDAGHGGKDVGAIGHNRVQEKVATLKMAKKLKRLIDRQPGMRAVLTRDKDVFIPLHERVKIAKKQDADMFISIHADAFHDHSVRGGSVYILSRGGASSVMARLLARSENASLQDVALKGRDEDVAFALSDLTREANIRASRKLAHTVLYEMQKKVKMHKHSVQSAKFAVLKSIDMPSLLIETAFISNPHEARNLMNNAFQHKMASAIVSGLSKFVEKNAQKPRWGESLYVYYKVQRGDTLSQIAENYQVSTSVLKKLNKIKNANELYVGRKVKIPLSDQVVAGL